MELGFTMCMDYIAFQKVCIKLIGNRYPFSLKQSAVIILMSLLICFDLGGVTFLSKTDIKVFFSLYLGITYKNNLWSEIRTSEGISEAFAFLQLNNIVRKKECDIWSSNNYIFSKNVICLIFLGDYIFSTFFLLPQN